MGSSGTQRYFISLLFFFSILLLAVPVVSAYSVSQVTDPAVPLYNGDAISIQVTGLSTGDSFKYRITSSDLNTMGDTIVSNNVNLPFGFKSYPNTHLSTTGYNLIANPLTIDYNNGAAHINPVFPANTNPIDLTNYAGDPGDYVVTLKGTKIPGSITTIDYSVNGTIATVPKPDPQILTFTIKNTYSGHLTIEVFDGSTSKFSATYTITTPSPTPVPTSSGGGDNDNPPAPAEKKGPQLAPPGYPSSSMTLRHNEDGKVLSESAMDTNPDPGFTAKMQIKPGTKVVTEAGKPVDIITLTPLDPASIPEAKGGVFSFAGIAVECEPSGTQFIGGEATLSITLSPELWATTLENIGGNPADLTVGFYDVTSGSWIYVPSTVDPATHTISARITHFTMYGLVYKTGQESSTILMANTSPAPSIAAGITDAPQITPVKTLLAPPSPTKSPGLPGIVVLAVICGVTLLIRKKKQ
jgi:hypothetical protein